MKHGRNWFIRGIVSSSIITSDGSCDLTKHSIFTNMFDYIEWIAEKTGVEFDRSTDSSEFEIITRSMWGALPPKSAIIYLQPPSNRIMISHTVTDECDNKEECIEFMQSIQRNHQQAQSFNDIYCNFFIGGDGLVFEGRGWTIRGEHTIGHGISHNDAICVSFIGDYQNHPPKKSQIDALFKLIDRGIATNMLVENYAINAQRDFHVSLSPGDAFYNVIKTWKQFRRSR